MSSRPWVRIPPAHFSLGGVAQPSRALACQARGRRFESGRPRFSWWPWCNGSTRGCEPRGAGSNPVGHLVRADAEHRVSSPRCKRGASRCGGSTPSVRTQFDQGDEALVESTSLATRRSGFDSRRLHRASVVSTASTRPLYGRGAGSTPAGGSSRGRSSVGRAPERHFGEARSIRAVRFRRPVV